jgi:PAS domain-containing protein
MVAAGFAILPVTATVLVAAAPPLVLLLGSRSESLRAMRQMALALQQDGFRNAWRVPRARSHQDIAAALAALARNHSASGRTGWLALDRRSGNLSWVGGYGITSTALAAASPNLAQEPWASAATTPTGTHCDQFLSAQELRCLLLPVRQQGDLLGFWITAHASDEPAPDGASLAALVRLLEPTLELPGVRGSRAVLDALTDRLQGELAQVRSLFDSAAFDRRRQLSSLQALSLPILVADAAGATLFTNAEAARLMQAGNLAPARSLRELIFRMHGEGGLTKTLQRLFLAHDSLRLSWQAPGGHPWELLVQPISTGDGAGAGAILGYVAWFEDRSTEARLRAVRDDLLHFASTRVRDDLMVVLGYTKLLEARGGDAGERAMLATIVERSTSIRNALDALEAATRPQGGEEQLQDLDLGSMARQAAQVVQPTVTRRGLRLTLDVPDVALPVVGMQEHLYEAIRGLLHHATTHATQGGAVRVVITEQEHWSEIEIGWEGTGLDPTMREAALRASVDQVDDLPEAIRELVLARAALPGMSIESLPGHRSTITTQLPRTPTDA